MKEHLRENGGPLQQVEIPSTRRKPLTKRQRKKGAHRTRRRRLRVVLGAPNVEVSKEEERPPSLSEFSKDTRPPPVPNERTRNLRADQARRRNKRKTIKPLKESPLDQPVAISNRSRSKKKQHKKPKYKETLTQLRQEIQEEEVALRSDDVRFKSNPRSALPPKATEARFPKVGTLVACRSNCGWKGSLSDLSAHYRGTGHGPPRNNLAKKKEE